MRVYCRPGATPIERLEARIAARLCSRPDYPQRVAGLLTWLTDGGPAREKVLRDAFPTTCVSDYAEGLGMARAVMVICGLSPEHAGRLTGDTSEDFNRLMEGYYIPADLGSPDLFTVPSLLEAYCHMGASFARGTDRVFKAVTGQSLAEHLRRALALLDPAL